MTKIIGIRREDKNEWEKRVPLVPKDVKELIEKEGVQILIQPSKIRIFKDEEYKEAGAKISEDLSSCSIILGVKEMPISFFEKEKIYLFFSHTIKGQPHNMPMLKKILELKASLIDYEKIVDSNNKRLIFFGRHAGIAGMIDTLWAYGERLNWEGIKTPFLRVKQAYHYKSIEEAKEEIKKVGEEIKKNGLPKEIVPLVCAFIGYGNVSQGAQEIFDLLPHQVILPKEIGSIFQKIDENSNNLIYKVIFKEEDLVEPISKEINFELNHYYTHPQNYKSIFSSYLPYITILVNCIYWDNKYPKFVKKSDIKELYSSQIKPRLRVIGDISCDIEGSIECNLKVTTPDNPIYVYDPFDDKIIDGYAGKGPVILAIDNLPCELSFESSTSFSNALKKIIPSLIKANFEKDYQNCNLPPEIKNALIVYHGELTPNYKYLNNFLSINL